MKEDTVQFYKLYAGRYTYFLTVKTKYDYFTNRPISYGLDLGGKMKGCVRASIDTINPQLDQRFQELQEENKYCFIAWIGYNEKCNINGNLESGQGTRHMVKTLMNFVKNNFHWITAFKLSDSSTIKCDDRNISLAALSLAKNGVTYYQKYYGAYLKNKELRTRFAEKVSMLTDPEKKLEYQEFTQIFQIPDHVVQKSKIHTIYKSSKTYTEFFKTLSRKPDFCALVNEWIERFINTVLGDNFWMCDWLIDVHSQNVNSINIKIEETQEDVQEMFKEYYQIAGARVCNGFTLADLDMDE